MNLTTTSNAISARFQASPALLTRIAEELLTWNTRSRQRYELAEMPDHALLDMGITRAQAIAEAAKPVWRR
jgi:uncharacterized protein YjiS (DUF1127 family)